MKSVALEGSLWVLFLYDVSEKITLGELQRILGTERPEREPSFRRPAPVWIIDINGFWGNVQVSYPYCWAVGMEMRF